VNLCPVMASEDRFAADVARIDAIKAGEFEDAKILAARCVDELVMADVLCEEWFSKAVQIGDPALIGRLVLMARDSYVERVAARQVYGALEADSMAVAFEEKAWHEIATHVAKMAGSI